MRSANRRSDQLSATDRIVSARHRIVSMSLTETLTAAAVGSSKKTPFKSLVDRVEEAAPTQGSGRFAEVGGLERCHTEVLVRRSDERPAVRVQPTELSVGHLAHERDLRRPHRA